jgi:hypothetical protein
MFTRSVKKITVTIYRKTNGTGVENSNEYEPNQNESNSNSEENLLYYNDTSVNSNHVFGDVNKYIVCNEIETSVGNVNFKYDFYMLNILYVNCCGLVNKLHFPEFRFILIWLIFVTIFDTGTVDNSFYFCFRKLINNFDEG